MTQPKQLVILPLLDHARRVREMMVGFGQTAPDAPTMPDLSTRVRRARLLLQECLEYVVASGLALEYSCFKNS